MKKLNYYFILFLSVLFTACQCPKDYNLNVGSFNIRYANDGDAERGNGWEQRAPVVCQLIRFHDFDIFGAQEVVHRQLNDMLAGLPSYAYIGVGRDDGETKGEYSPIFYKTDKFRLLKSGTFWLSPTDTENPNKGWDAALPRVCSWAQFEFEGKKFWFFNTHFDHVGVEARRESAKLMMAKMQEMCANEPIILTGDFNVNQNNESYELFHSADFLDDCYEKTQIRYALNGTFNSFNVNQWTDSRIDHIFVSPEFDVLRYGVLTDSYRVPIVQQGEITSSQEPENRQRDAYEGRSPSDHFPIMVQLHFNK